MGQLIAAAPTQPNDPPRDRIRQFIATCIQQTTGGSITAFADIVEIDRFVIYAWIRKHLPPTEAVLKICYRFGLSFSDLVTKGDVAPEFELNEQFQMLTLNSSLTDRRKTDLIKRGLLAALEEDPPLTLQQVADRLGYKLPRSLYGRFPDLAKRLTARRRTFVSTTTRQPTKHRSSDLESALQGALEQELPPSLSAIAQAHGYDRTAEMRSRYNDLCEAIKIRRAQYFEKRKNDIRNSLKLMLVENPPPSPAEASKRVGYRTETGIRTSHTELFEALLKRYRKYRKAQFEDTRRQLRAALKEEPPPRLREMVVRLRKRYLYLHEHFPKECQAIVVRYARFAKKHRARKKALAKARMRRLALELYENESLSIKRLRKASKGPTGLECSELAAVLRSVKRELVLR